MPHNTIPVTLTLNVDHSDRLGTPAVSTRREATARRTLTLADALTFGVEIECHLPLNVRIAIGEYHDGCPIQGWPDGWNAQSDGSLRAPSGFRPVEIVSGILSGTEGLKQVADAIRRIRDWGGRVNCSCGFHVHVGWNPREHSTHELKRLIHLVARHEAALYASTGTQRRESGTYAQPIREDFRGLDYANLHDRLANSDERHKLLNVTNLFIDHGKRTVEFRAFAGTLNTTKAVGYVRLALGLVEKAMLVKRCVPYDAKAPKCKSLIRKKGGKGQSELLRLFYALGWTAGDSKHVYGNVGTEAGSGLPSIKSNKRWLLRMARKYDERIRPSDNRSAAAAAADDDTHDDESDVAAVARSSNGSVQANADGVIYLADRPHCNCHRCRSMRRSRRCANNQNTATPVAGCGCLSCLWARTRGEPDAVLVNAPAEAPAGETYACEGRAAGRDEDEAILDALLGDGRDNSGDEDDDDEDDMGEF